MCWGCAGGLCHFFVFSLIRRRHFKKEVAAVAVAVAVAVVVAVVVAAPVSVISTITAVAIESVRQ